MNQILPVSNIIRQQSKYVIIHRSCSLDGSASVAVVLSVAGMVAVVLVAIVLTIIIIRFKACWSVA